MTCLLNPYRYGAGAAAAPFGALVRKSTGDQTIGTGATTLNWDTETYDPDGWHSTSSNTSRMTVPASGVSLVAVTSNIKVGGNNPLLEHRKNGSTFVGMGKADAQGGSGNYTNCSSAPIAVSPSDYLETVFTYSSGTTTPTNDEETWFAIEKLDASTKYAIVKNSGSLSLSAGTNTTLSFDTETVDTNAFHDNVTNPSRLTVPSGVSLVRLRANAASGSVAGQFFLFMNKNGATARGLPMRDCDTSAEENLNLISAPLEVTAGDYFELVAFATNATSIPSADYCWFSIEEVVMPATYKRALAYKSGSQTIAANNFAVPLTWESEQYDTGTIRTDLTSTVTITIASPGVITWTGHTFVADQPVVLTTSGALPTGLTAGTTYYVVSPAANTFSLATAPGGAAINTSGSQSGTHTGTNTSRLVVPSGCTKARPIVGIKTSSANSEMSVLVRKNGADYFGMPRYNCDTAGTDNLNVAGAWVDVSPGDYFEALFYSFAGCTVGTDNETFFCLECI